MWRTRSGRNAVLLVRAAQGKRIEEGNCRKKVDQSDSEYGLSKTEQLAREHSKSGTHYYLRQGTESQSYKQDPPQTAFFQRRRPLKRATNRKAKRGRPVRAPDSCTLYGARCRQRVMLLTNAK